MLEMLLSIARLSAVTLAAVVVTLPVELLVFVQNCLHQPSAAVAALR